MTRTGCNLKTADLEKVMDGKAAVVEATTEAYGVDDDIAVY